MNQDKIEEVGRLLTRGKIRELRILHSSQYETYELEFCKAQRDLTVSIKDAECQQRVERIFREADKPCIHYGTETNKWLKRCCDDCWQALKQEGMGD